MTHTTRTFDKMGETTQTVVRTSQESARILTDYTVKAQELNTQFARRAVGTWIDGLRKQTELSQDVAQELFGRAEEQADAYKRFFGQWGNVPLPRHNQQRNVPLPEAGDETRRYGCEERGGDHGDGNLPHRRLRREERR